MKEEMGKENFEMKNQGYHSYRLPTNPIENIFAEEWEKENARTLGTDLIDILFNPSYREHSWYLETYLATDEERRIAATIIQWLGSAVGQSFLETVNERMKAIKGKPPSPNSRVYAGGQGQQGGEENDTNNH